MSSEDFKYLQLPYRHRYHPLTWFIFYIFSFQVPKALILSLPFPLVNRDDVPDGYVVPAKVGIDELQQKDAEDESLAKYKAQLLGNASCEPLCQWQAPLIRGVILIVLIDYIVPDDPRLVVVKTFTIVADGRDPMVFNPHEDTVHFVRLHFHL